MLEYENNLASHDYDEYLLGVLEEDEKHRKSIKAEASRVGVDYQRLETRTIAHYENVALEKRISDLADMMEKKVKSDTRSAYQRSQDELKIIEQEKNKDKATYYRLLLSVIFISVMYIVTCITTCTIHSNELELEKAALNTESWKSAYWTLKEEVEQK